MDRVQLRVLAGGLLGVVMGVSTTIFVVVAKRMDDIGLQASNTGQGAPNLIWLWLTLFVAGLIFIGSSIAFVLLMFHCSPSANTLTPQHSTADLPFLSEPMAGIPARSGPCSGGHSSRQFNTADLPIADVRRPLVADAGDGELSPAIDQCDIANLSTWFAQVCSHSNRRKSKTNSE